MTITWNDSIPIYRQLHQRVVAMILDGALNEGDPLPSVRQVAADFQINPLTVSKAYQELVDERLRDALALAEEQVDDLRLREPELDLEGSRRALDGLESLGQVRRVDDDAFRERGLIDDERVGVLVGNVQSPLALGVGDGLRLEAAALHRHPHIGDGFVLERDHPAEVVVGLLLIPAGRIGGAGGVRGARSPADDQE